MRPECGFCPIQAECAEIVQEGEKILTELTDSKLSSMSRVEASRAIQTSLYDRRENVEHIKSQLEEIGYIFGVDTMTTIDEAEELLTIIENDLESLPESIDRELELLHSHIELERKFAETQEDVEFVKLFASFIGATCVGPIPTKKYLAFGEVVVCCSSPVGLIWQALHGRH